MCAILDANAIHEVFGSNLPEAGEAFFRWLRSGSGRLVVGGENLRELRASDGGLREWQVVAERIGQIRRVDDDVVDTEAEELVKRKVCLSNDAPIIALARISGARLLYTKETSEGNRRRGKRLIDDFKRKDLIDGPRGKVFRTTESGRLERSHQNLLRRDDLCGTQ